MEALSRADGIKQKVDFSPVFWDLKGSPDLGKEGWASIPFPYVAGPAGPRRKCSFKKVCLTSSLISDKLAPMMEARM